jgi:lysophospholipase L1-like esterase
MSKPRIRYVHFAATALTCAAFGCTGGGGSGSHGASALSQADTASAGTLTTAIFHAAPGGTFADPGTELSLMASYAATSAPDYTFADGTSAFVFDGNDHGGSGAPTSTFLGRDASGAASSDAQNVADTIVDAKGYFVAAAGGSYHFHIGATDDAAGIYIDGNGTSGSGTLVVSNNYTEGNTADATVTLTAGATIAVEVLYGNGYGGAGLDGVTITDASGKQVGYTPSPSGTGGDDTSDAGSGPSGDDDDGTTPPTGGLAGGIFVLENVAFSQALAVSQASSYDGNVLVTYSVNSAPGQQFEAVASGSGYLLQEQIAGRCLEVDGSALTIATCNGAATQSFALTLGGDGAYTIGASDGQCLDASGSFGLVGASACSGGADQIWYFTQVGGTTTPVDAGAPVDAGGGTPPVDAGGGTPPTGPLGSLPQNFKLMTLGDSMTAGYGAPDIGGYRGPLYQSLLGEGYTPQMVGAQSCGQVNDLPAADQSCDGVGGATIEATDARVTAGAGLVATEDPDVVLLLIGFNSVYYEQNTIAQDLSLLSGMVDHIMAQKPTARLVVASLIASTQCCGTDLIKQYNAGIPGIVSAKAAQGYPVSFVDLYPVVPPQDLYDYVHPNEQGYPLVASAWLGAINAIAGH